MKALALAPLLVVIVGLSSCGLQIGDQDPEPAALGTELPVGNLGVTVEDLAFTGPSPSPQVEPGLGIRVPRPGSVAFAAARVRVRIVNSGATPAATPAVDVRCKGKDIPAVAGEITSRIEPGAIRVITFFARATSADCPDPLVRVRPLFPEGSQNRVGLWRAD